MKKLTLLVELEYDDEMMHNGDKDLEAKEWFFHTVLRDDLDLFSGEIGDTIGEIKIIRILNDLDGEMWKRELHIKKDKDYVWGE